MVSEQVDPLRRGPQARILKRTYPDSQVRFLRRIPSRCPLGCGGPNQTFRLDREELEDTILWLIFLAKARIGISLNNLTLQEPSQIAISDSCPFGMGGFISSGRAWRLQIPKSSILYGDDTANNFLELLAIVVTIWLVIKDCDDRGLMHEHILGLGDNTSAIGWLYRTRGVKKATRYDRPVNFVARKLAIIVMESNHSLASQNCPGDSNVVSDLLSFQGTDRLSEWNGKSHPLAPDPPSNTELNQRFRKFLPQLIPPDFDILPLPKETACFVTDAMQIAESSWMLSKKVQMRTQTASGGDR